MEENEVKVEEVSVESAVSAKEEAPKKGFFKKIGEWFAARFSDHVFMAMFLTFFAAGLLIVEEILARIFVGFNASRVLLVLFFVLISASAFGGFFYAFTNKVKSGDKNMDFLLALNVVLLWAIL